MIYSQLTQILCFILIVNYTIKNVRAISLDEIFEYFFDDSGESSEELANSSLNVTCKNCTLSVECHNCTQSHKHIQSTVPIQTTTQNNQHPTSSSLPTPTIPAPERVVETVSSYNVPSESIATASQSVPTTIATPVANAASTNINSNDSPLQTASTKSIGDENNVTDDGANLTTDAILNSSDGVTSGNEETTN